MKSTLDNNKSIFHRYRIYIGVGKNFLGGLSILIYLLLSSIDRILILTIMTTFEITKPIDTKGNNSFPNESQLILTHDDKGLVKLTISSTSMLHSGTGYIVLSIDDINNLIAALH